MNITLRILRRGHQVSTVSIDAQPGGIAAMQDALRGWLTGNGWAEGLWPQFEAEYQPEHGKPVRVRA